MSVPLSDEQKEKITISDLAILVFRLEKEGKVSIQNLQELLQQLCPENKRDYAINNHPNREFTLKFYEAIALLKRRGLLMDVLDLGYAMTPMPAVRPTSVWEKSLIQDEIIILIDEPQEIIASLKEQIPNLDPVVEQYYLESLRACQKELYIASVICLGAASEKVIHCLADAVIRYDSNYDSKIKRYRSKASKLIDYLSANAENIFGSVADKQLIWAIREQLDLVAHIYRLNRNEAGHPSRIPDVKRSTQETYLCAFHQYCKTIFKGINLLYPNL